MDDRLAKNAARRDERARTFGQDGHALLAMAFELAAPGWLRQMLAIEILRRVWVQQFYLSAEGMQWRTAEHGIPPSSIFLGSSYDTDAHLACKRTTKWIGYKAHLTETCDNGNPCFGLDVKAVAKVRAPDGRPQPRCHHPVDQRGLDEILELADRIAVVRHGAIVHEAPAAGAAAKVIGAHVLDAGDPAMAGKQA